MILPFSFAGRTDFPEILLGSSAALSEDLIHLPIVTVPCRFAKLTHCIASTSSSMVGGSGYQVSQASEKKYRKYRPFLNPAIATLWKYPLPFGSYKNGRRIF
jgi:hypothetical protein